MVFMIFLLHLINRWVNPGDKIMISGINVGYVENIKLEKLSVSKNEN